MTLREAARVTRNALLAKCGSSLYARCQTFASVARAVWRGDATLARSLITSSPLAGEMLQIINGKPALTNPLVFETDNADARREWYVQERAAIAADPQSARRSRARLRCVSRIDLFGAPR